MGFRITPIITRREVDRPGDLLRLLAWFSPSFPVGAFSYSHGLEWAIDAGVVADRASLTSWLSDLAERGSGWNDMVLLAAAWRGEDVAALAESMSPSAERQLETMQLGAAFALAALPWIADLPRGPFPVAVGAACARMSIGIEAALAAFLHSFLANLISVAVRLIPLGHVQGLAVLHELEPMVLATALRAAASNLDDLGSATILSDIASMRHEVQHKRVFRS
jgi:urease accessory protein